MTKNEVWYKEFDRKWRLRKPSWGLRIGLVTFGLPMIAISVLALQITSVGPHNPGHIVQWGMIGAGVVSITTGLVWRVRQLRSWRRRVAEDHG